MNALSGPMQVQVLCRVQRARLALSVLLVACRVLEAIIALLVLLVATTRQQHARLVPMLLVALHVFHCQVVNSVMKLQAIIPYLHHHPGVHCRK